MVHGQLQIQFYTNRAVSNYFLSQDKKAIYDFKEVIKTDPYIGQAYLVIAECYISLNETHHACEYLSAEIHLGIEEVNDAFKRNCEKKEENCNDNCHRWTTNNHHS